MNDDSTYELKMSARAFSALRYEVRAAQARLSRDTRLGLETPRRVVALSEIGLPQVGRRYRLVRSVRSRVDKSFSDIWSDVPPRELGHGLDQSIEESVAETPMGVEVELTDGTKSEVAAPERPETSTVGHIQPARVRPVAGNATLAPVATPEAEHSGHVTLYLPSDLSRWLTDHPDLSQMSYPGFVLNAIGWAARGDRLSEIFSPESSAIPVNDIFGRASIKPKSVRDSNGAETRPIKFRKDHMKVNIGLARTWTADNRNAFFVGILTAYRDHEIGISA